jgi:hypothetical protein
LNVEHLDFVLVSDFGIRASDFLSQLQNFLSSELLSSTFCLLTPHANAFVFELFRYLLNEMVKSFLNVAGKIVIG